mmetsp:Transcript_28529/g.40639  ORF Transcript_28529/g.40639 Transcript_28529/m.40639 type:complete len:416 (+) Transcript_28529:229-1476(+)|eukprot:CAMPEP_0201106272 /NCGR_PEP_ID=MMETSP0812-20130820/50590_1 /ASSEMBLY_ACC=CAM_ASM_000668 /TAXON_ID=98059 /ORGANISM="Dinobryon sp., Strain UTEXLB2267" /LENGTH=415 /DNA_ID=CAMNT_0047366537 /DNA_START=190 /DNA_END=1437 /DNA_ORIENTATION=-
MDGDDNDYDEGGTLDDSKETTGRWTKEEHLTFIKGLEMYGKGWKKIASLVKTRTVVQIRTHAQKYFLKLAKARQTGETSSSGALLSSDKSIGPCGRKRKLKRRPDRTISVALPLQPFIKPTANRESLRSHDIEDCLYNFLSPNFAVTLTADSGSFLLPTQPPPCPQHPQQSVIKIEKAVEAAENDSISPRSSAGSGSNRFVSHQLLQSDSVHNQVAGDGEVDEDFKQPASRLLLHSSISKPPLWYLTGQQVSSLLKDAEELDWLQDHTTLYGPVNASLTEMAAGVNENLNSILPPEQEPSTSFEQPMEIDIEGIPPPPHSPAREEFSESVTLHVEAAEGDLRAENLFNLTRKQPNEMRDPEERSEGSSGAESALTSHDGSSRPSSVIMGVSEGVGVPECGSFFEAVINDRLTHCY